MGEESDSLETEPSLSPAANPLTAGVPHRVDRPRLLIGEGAAEFMFLSALLRHMGVADAAIEHYGGKDNLGNYLHLLKTRAEFVRGQIVALGIFRDADDDCDAAFASVRGALANEKLPQPPAMASVAAGRPSIGVFIMPGGNRQGMLETLCMESVADDPAVECVDTFVECVKAKGIIPKPLAKVRARAWITTRAKPDIPVGPAAREGYWRFDHPCFEALKAFIRSL